MAMLNNQMVLFFVVFFPVVVVFKKKHVIHILWMLPGNETYQNILRVIQ